MATYIQAAGRENQALQNKLLSESLTSSQSSSNCIDKIDAVVQALFDSRIVDVLTIIAVASFTATKLVALGYTAIFVVPIVLSVGFALASFYVYVKRAEFQQEISLLLSLFRKHVLDQDWCTTILEDELVLTALPIESLGHRKEFERLNIKAVLTVVEPWELETKVLGLKPIKDWGKGVVHKQISTPDMSSVALPFIHEGSDFIHENISLGRKVAVHCKAGIGRSAAMVMGYLVKHRGFESARNAYAFTSSKRPQIMLSGKQGRIIDQANVAA